jgi:hypothetical protein
MRYVLGIDHGFQGCLCLFDRDTDAILLSPIPVRDGQQTSRCLHLEEDTGGTDYDMVKLAELLGFAAEHADWDIVAVMEETQLQHRQGFSNIKSMASLFRSRGMLESLCAVLGIPLYSMHPTSWKTKIGLIDRSKGKAKSKDEVKKAALALAHSLRPGEEFYSADAAESYLIAKVFSEHYAHTVPKKLTPIVK